MSRTKRRRKAQRSPDKYLASSIRIIDAGLMGRRPQPFRTETAVDQFRSWVYAAVTLNSNAVAATPLRMFVRKRIANRLKLWNTRVVPRNRKRYLLDGSSSVLGPVCPHRETTRKLLELGDDFEEMSGSHPVLRLLRDVNPWYNGFDLLQLLTIYLELTGNAYVHPVIGAIGVPAELWPMPSQWTWVQPSRDNFIDGYIYGHGQENQLMFEVDEVIHFRTANPGRDGLFYGMGKVEAGWGAIALNAKNHEMDLSMSENMGRPDYVVIVKSGAGPDQLDRFERRIEQQLRGTRNSGKFLSISGDVHLEPLNFPPKDLVGREDIVEEIAAIIGVPISLLKANDPNLSNAKVGFASWRSNSILPLTSLIEGKLNETLLPKFGIEGDVVLAFDNPVPADEEFQLREHAQLVGFGIMKRNEARAERGLDPVPGGDDLLVQQGLIPIENVDDFADMQLDQVGRMGFPSLGSGGMVLPRLPSLPSGTPQLTLTPSGLKDAVRDGIAEAVAKEKAEETMRDPSDAGHETPSLEECVRRRAIELIEVGVEPKRAVERAEEDCGARSVEDEASSSSESAGGSGGPGDPGTGGGRGGSRGPLGASMTDMMHKAWDGKAKGDLPNLPESGAVPGFIRDMENLLEQMVESVERSVARSSGGTASQIVSLLSDRTWEERVANAALQFLGDAIDLGGAAGDRKITEMEELPAAFDFEFNVQSPEVVDFVRQWSVRLGGQVTEHVQTRLSATLADGIEAGESVTQLTARVRDWAGRHDPERGLGKRAERIARTESARAYVAGEAIAWRQSGIVQGKVWLLAPNPCEFCKATEATFKDTNVGIDEAFYELGAVVKGAEGGSMLIDYQTVFGPPLHPNCRCDILPVLKVIDE